ncbi:hypothetical protein Ccrd_020220 [Cynara cardunculus var. scolymus]|uniref:DNA-directed RNA polymerase III, subunit Rpc31 n=1 Tax=Cynara cardunculus var. scolymus TaxID=59895 RepID=A0A103Y2U6_CYNCS|nr:hypothetical protein Ccrd_020220 [Cynara cardunculus var. scolymus]
MAFRGRGRGRGGFGFGVGRFAKEEKYELFPEIKELPDVNLKQKEEEFRTLVSCGNDLQKFWISSPYHLEEVSQDAERSGGIIRRPPLSDYMKMTDDYVPAELVARNVRQSKKVRWDPQSDLQRLDLFEKLDRGPQGPDDGDKEKKEDEDEDEDNENNIDFDDDEDDFNMPDDVGGDEGFY